MLPVKPGTVRVARDCIPVVAVVPHVLSRALAEGREEVAVLKGLRYISFGHDYCALLDLNNNGRRSLQVTISGKLLQRGEMMNGSQRYKGREND